MDKTAKPQQAKGNSRNRKGVGAGRSTAQSPRALTDIPVTELKGVGKETAVALSRIGLNSIADLLFHLPFRYEDRTRVYPIGDLSPGMTVNCEGMIHSAKLTFGRRRQLVVELVDGGHRLQCRFFQFSAAQKSRLTPGKKMRCFGEVSGSTRALSMFHPEYTLIDSDQMVVPVDECLTPVYSVTEGVKQRSMRKICLQAIQYLDRFPPAEFLPKAHLEEHIGASTWSLAKALAFLHAPTPDVSIEELEFAEHPALRRLVFEELIAHQLSMMRLKSQNHNKQAPKLATQMGLQEKLLTALPFKPTAAQQRVVTEINVDIAKGFPMQRLVQGDVGSGKTLVAALAALRAIENQGQVALMAPTEILAEQHFLWFSQHLAPLDKHCVFLTSKMSAKEKKASLAAIVEGNCDIAIGTHALFQEQVKFANLVLVIIDEQHRFGVHQRMDLKKKGEGTNHQPHLLIMTATPIPRTLSMTSFANLDKSIIDELPPGRQPIKTVAIADSRRDEVIEKVHAAVKDQRQVYWVCTLIDESELIQSQAAAKVQEELQEKLSDTRIGLVHGRLKPEEKQLVMAQFKAGKLDILVATTVIEVGVNVPNASLMIIENPERLGLAQLHQLRGRVGRGEIESHCVLLYRGPLSKNGRARLAAMRETNDGFVIAEKDLKIRGPGEILGTKQTGMVNYRIADLIRDQGWLSAARRCADSLVKNAPEKVEPLIQRWIGEKTQYGDS